MAQYCKNGVRRQDSFLTEMQKLEFYREDKIHEKEDRGIQFRSPTYNAALARHLHHVEKRTYGRMRNEDGTPKIAKGRSPIERGLILAAQAQDFVKPCFIMMDHSRFDAHVNAQLLAEEHKFYLRARGYNKELKQLLKWQEKNIGFSSGGIVYKIKAKRCSGDLNTALGNSILNLAMIESWVKVAGVGKHTIFLDGDDSVVIIEEEQKHLTGSITRHMLACGMRTEVQLAGELERTEFCQSRICWGKLGPVMVRNPYKTIDVLTKSPRAVDNVQATGILAASALGEIMQAPGVPVIAPAASRLLTMSASLPRFTTPDAFERFLVYRANRLVVEVDETMRESFEFAWGITVAEQMAIEQYYSELAEPTEEIPPIIQPKSRDVEWFHTWDDCSLPFEDEEEDAWWKRQYPLGSLLG